MQELISDNNEVITAIAKYDVLLLKNGSFKLRDNLTIAKAAVLGNPDFIKYATDNLKDSLELLSFAAEL
mgnify:CR=1 FL=1